VCRSKKSLVYSAKSRKTSQEVAVKVIKK